MANARSPSLDTVRQLPYWRDAEARIVVNAWRRSGQTPSAFGAEHDLDPRRLGRWIARLGGSSPKPSVRFHPVRVVPPTVEAPSVATPPETVDVVLPNGYVVRVSPQLAAPDLHAVLALLRDAPRC